MLTLLTGIALGAYSLKTLLSLAGDATAKSAAAAVKGAASDFLGEARAGFAEAVTKARAERAASMDHSAESVIATVFGRATPR